MYKITLKLNIRKKSRGRDYCLTRVLSNRYDLYEILRVVWLDLCIPDALALAKYGKVGKNTLGGKFGVFTNAMKSRCGRRPTGDWRGSRLRGAIRLGVQPPGILNIS